MRPPDRPEWTKRCSNCKRHYGRAVINRVLVNGRWRRSKPSCPFCGKPVR